MGSYAIGDPLCDGPCKDKSWFSKKSCNICLVLCVVCCVLMCATVSAVQYSYTLSLVRDFEETVAILKKEISELRRDVLSGALSSQEDDGYDSHSLDQAGEHSRSKRNAKDNKVKGKPKGLKLVPKVPPFAHLVGRHSHLIPEGNTTYFPWDRSKHDQGMHGFELVGDPAKGFHKIRVKNQGVYIVYSQVAVNGRHHINLPHECSHETVIHRSGERIVLLTSLVTQYQLGESYQSNVHNQPLRALDTKVHLGVFLLLKNDELSVQVPKNCGSMVYSLTEKNSYLGVAEISHRWAKVEFESKTKESSSSASGEISH